MCDPITLMMMVSAGTGLMGAMKSEPKPPPAVTPAVAAPTNRTPGAIVRLGNGANDIDNTDANEPTLSSAFTETRKSARAIGGLGRSGLAL